MGRDTIQLEDAVSTISKEYLLQFTSEYGMPESLHPELPGLEDTIVGFPEGKVGVYTKFFEFANFLQRLTLHEVRVIARAHSLHMPSVILVRTVASLSIGGVSQKSLVNHCLDGFWSHVVWVGVVNSGIWSSSGRRTLPRAAHEVPLLTATANRIIEMEDTVVASGSSGTPAAIEKSPLDFADENPPLIIIERGDIATAKVIPKASLEKEVTAMGPSTLRGKSLAAIEIEAGSAVPAPATQETPVSDPNPLSYAEPRPTPEQDIAQSSKKVPVAEDPDSEKSTSFTSMVGSPGSIYQPGWGVTNNCRLDTPAVCQDVVDHIVPPGYFSELRHLPQDDFLSRYNINLAQQVATGSQLRLREKHIKNLKALLEAEADMKKAAEAKNVELVKELEGLCVQFSDLQVSNKQLSQ
ncbi:hypothetical protein Tco_1148464, partial [Tanacetum coccineum]